MDQPEHAQDHIPLKDQFSSDESQPPSQRQEKAQKSLVQSLKQKKIKKVFKNFKWALKWVKVNNIVPDSQPVFIKKWVKIKISKQERSESEEKSISKSQKDDDDDIQQGDAEDQLEEDQQR